MFLTPETEGIQRIYIPATGVRARKIEQLLCGFIGIKCLGRRIEYHFVTSTTLGLIQE